MSDTSPSLILAEESRSLTAPLFFPEFAKPEFERLEARGEFTGQRLFDQDREKYDFVVMLLGEGTIPDAYIAGLCKVSRNTIVGVRDREKIPIEHIKERIRANIRTGLHMAAERLIELIPTMTAKDAIIAVGVLTEKMQLLSGEATAIIATAGDKLRHADFNDLLASLPEADARVVAMGSPFESEGQKGGSDSGPMLPLKDAESLVLKSSSAQSNELNNKTIPIPASPEGGRGVADEPGGGNPN